MARIRTIKPEFWSDDAVTSCSRDARLLYIGIWNFADDAGNLDRSAKQIKARVFPVDDVNCEVLVVELMTNGLLVEYSVEGKKYLHIPGFTRHQLINRPSKPTVPRYESSLSTQGGLSEGSVSTHAGKEGKGMEGNGREGNVSVMRAHASAGAFETRDAINRIKARYPIAARQDWLSAEKYARQLVTDRGVSWADLEAGVDRYAKHVEATGRMALNPSRFFHDVDDPWSQPWPIPKKANAAVKHLPTTAELEERERIENAKH